MPAIINNIWFICVFVASLLNDFTFLLVSIDSLEEGELGTNWLTSNSIVVTMKM